MPTEIQKLYFEIKILTKRSQGEQTATAPATGIFSPSSPRYFICMQIFKWNNAVPKTSSLHTCEKVNIRQIPGLIVWKADSVCTKCNDTSKKKHNHWSQNLLKNMWLGTSIMYPLSYLYSHHGGSGQRMFMTKRNISAINVQTIVCSVNLSNNQCIFRFFRLQLQSIKHDQWSKEQID